jgi:hypothetical protein
MQKCFMSKFIYLRETTLFLQGCTIFTIFATAQFLWQFVPSKNSKSIPKLQIRQQDKRFDDENVVADTILNMKYCIYVCPVSLAELCIAERQLDFLHVRMSFSYPSYARHDEGLWPNP